MWILDHKCVKQYAHQPTTACHQCASETGKCTALLCADNCMLPMHLWTHMLSVGFPANAMVKLQEQGALISVVMLRCPWKAYRAIHPQNGFGKVFFSCVCPSALDPVGYGTRSIESLLMCDPYKSCNRSQFCVRRQMHAPQDLSCTPSPGVFA
eukprot:42695-Pelagomonas_calceolata.AAC.5